MIIKTIFKYMLVSTMILGLTFAQSETEVDPIEKARQAKEAADKAAAEAESLKEAAVEAAAQKAAKEARQAAKQKKEEEEARKLAEKQAAEEAELDAAAQAAADEAKRKMAAELGLELDSEDGESTVDADTTPAGDTTAVVADTTNSEEEHYVSGGAGYNIGVSGSLGFIQGTFFENIPTGGSLVISTPWGFDIGAIRFGLSATIGAYPAKHNTGVTFTPLAMGVGGNLTLAKIVFAEGHVGTVGDDLGGRGFAGVSLENLMKKGLNLPFNVLVGGEGFFSTKLKEGVGAEAPDGSATYWGGVAFRLDYNF